MLEKSPNNVTYPITYAVGRRLLILEDGCYFRLIFTLYNSRINPPYIITISYFDLVKLNITPFFLQCWYEITCGVLKVLVVATLYTVYSFGVNQCLFVTFVSYLLLLMLGSGVPFYRRVFGGQKFYFFREKGFKVIIMKNLKNYY